MILFIIYNIHVELACHTGGHKVRKICPSTSVKHQCSWPHQCRLKESFFSPCPLNPGWVHGSPLQVLQSWSKKTNINKLYNIKYVAHVFIGDFKWAIICRIVGPSVHGNEGELVHPRSPGVPNELGTNRGLWDKVINHQKGSHAQPSAQKLMGWVLKYLVTRAFRKATSRGKPFSKKGVDIIQRNYGISHCKYSIIPSS